MWLLLVAVSVFYADASPCTEVCDAKWAIDAKKVTTICATDGNTHSFHFHRWMSSDPCYPKCGVGMLYPGKCGCPNECMAHMKQGTCVDIDGTPMCQCAKGWSGPDCSNIKCPNVCSRNGLCRTYSPEFDPPGGSDSCICKTGFTGYDCSVKKHDMARNPYGNIFPEAPAYARSEPYRDEHPLFNISVLFNIRVTLSDADLKACLDPARMYTQEYKHANFYFENGNIRRAVNDVGFKIKGAWSRMDMKKGWSVSFNKFSKARRFFRAKKIGLKGSLPSDSTVKNQFANELGRAMSLQVMRTSWGTLYINDIFWGLYWMHEDIDNEFLYSRFGNLEGNLYKLHSVYMTMPSENPRFYQEQRGSHPMGIAVVKYEQDDGNGDWSDWIELLRTVRDGDTKSPAFQTRLSHMIDIPTMLRWCVLETLMQDSDGFGSNGNNFLWYHYTKEANPDADQWYFMRIDFDNSDLAADLNPSYWWTRFYGRNPLIKHIFSIYNQTYMNMFGQLIDMTFGAFSPSPPPAVPLAVQRYAKYRDFLKGMYERDFFWQTSNGCLGGDFVRAADKNIERIPRRIASLRNSVPRFTPDRRVWVRPVYGPERGVGDGGMPDTSGRKGPNGEALPEVDDGYLGNGNGDGEGIPADGGQDGSGEPDETWSGTDQQGEGDGNGDSDSGGDHIGDVDMDEVVPEPEDTEPKPMTIGEGLLWGLLLVLTLVGVCVVLHLIARYRKPLIQLINKVRARVRGDGSALPLTSPSEQSSDDTATGSTAATSSHATLSRGGRFAALGGVHGGGAPGTNYAQVDSDRAVEVHVPPKRGKQPLLLGDIPLSDLDR